jgi:radical SAM protein with 4Fe4S-binding SPASM domain
MLPVLHRLGFAPRFCVWELTLRCDLRCLHCGSFAGTPRPDELTAAELFDVAEQLAELGCEKVTLSGGEPTLRPEWDQVGRRLVDRGVSVNVISNGWAWTSETTRRALEAGLSNAAFSLDGPEAAHDKVRGRPGSYQRVVAATDDCIKHGLPVAILTHINTLNLHELESFHGLLREHGVGSWQIQIGTPTGNLGRHKSLAIEPKELLTLIPRVAALRGLGGRPEVFVADNVGYYGIYERALRDRGATICFWIGCRAGCQVIGIESHGNVKGCLSLPSQRQAIDEFVEGNLRQATLRAIWERPGAFAFNRNYDVNQLQGFCGRCRFRDICRGGCSCAAFGFSGSRFDNPLCFYRVAVEHERWDLIPDPEEEPARAGAGEPTDESELGARFDDVRPIG